MPGCPNCELDEDLNLKPCAVHQQILKTSRPAPIEHPGWYHLTEDHALTEAQESRNLNCPHYDACLDVTVKSKWTGFACTSCPINVVRSLPIESARLRFK